MKRLLLAACVTLTTTGAVAQDVQQPSDTRPIEAVVEAFRASIIAKDKAALDALPLNPGITFASATDPATLAWVRKRRPDAKRVATDSYPEFVRYVIGSKDQLEEVFSDVSIRTDGTVATVYFAYQFKENGKVTNSGHENWGLLATDAGWKITSIIWSVTVPPQDRR